MKRQVISRQRWFQRRENENLAARADFKNCAAAITDVQILLAIERDPRRHTHAFNPLFRAAIRRNAMDRAVIAARYEKIASAVHRQSAGINQRRDEWFHAVVR